MTNATKARQTLPNQVRIWDVGDPQLYSTGPNAEIPAGRPFTTPLGPEQIPSGATILPAGPLRVLRVNKRALEDNSYLEYEVEERARDREDAAEKYVPTIEVHEESRPERRFFSVEVRGSCELVNG